MTDRPDCPMCGSGKTEPHVYGTSGLDAIFAVYYPRARNCTKCGHLWDQAARDAQTQFQELMLAHIKKATP